MKNLIKISFLIVAAIISSNDTHAQRRASDKPFTTVLSEVKQHQAMRNKMLQQMRPPAPLPAANSTNNTTPREAASTPEPLNQQRVNRTTANKPVTQPRFGNE